jgi:ABC-2 type transport system permease protein
MSTVATQISQPAGNNILGMYLAEARYELIKVSRTPSYFVPTLAFPVLFYVMFGLVLNRHQSLGSVTLATYMLATYGAFGVIGASLFGFAVSISNERGYGWLQVKRASPMPPLAYLLAKTFVCLIFSTIVVLLLIGLGMAFGGAKMSPTMLVEFVLTLVAGSFPFCAIGLAIGCLAPPTSAPMIVNAVFLPLSFCSGLWLPLQILPRIFQQAAPLLPPYHLGQLALRIAGAPSVGSTWQHVSALGAFTVVFLLLARRGFTREDVTVSN